MPGPLSGVEAARASVPSTGGGTPPPPPPPPSGDLVTIGTVLALPTPTGKANTRTGITSVHSQSRTGADGAITKAIIGAASTIQNQHLIGFGSNVDPKPGASAAYNWSFMDATFGFPTKASGYFSTAQELCLTACGCPPHMRVPKTGKPVDPMGARSGTQLTSLSDYSPPHSSWMPEYAQLIADFMVRYPHVKYIHVWNELKGFYFSTQSSGSALVPVGSGLVQDAGTSNRWWSEGYTYMFNLIWDAVKAVRPDAFIVGPYNVLNSFSWDQSSDWSNDAAPDDYFGPWGYGDKKVLKVHRYFLRYCHGADALAMDIRNLTKDSGVGGYYSIPSVPGAPDPASQWLSNPDGGNHVRFWKEGQEDGAWNNGQKLTDWVDWVRRLGASSTVYQRPVCDARKIPVWAGEWYAYGARPQFKAADPHTGNYYNEPTSSHAEEACAFAWQWLYALECGLYAAMFWKPEGNVQGNVNDPGDSNPLALYYEKGSPLSLQKTELAPVMEGIVAKFPVGTQMYEVSTTSKYLRGCASAAWLMVCNRKPTPMSFNVVDPDDAAPTLVTLAGYQVKFIDRGGSDVGASGIAMPATDTAGTTRVFADDFSAYASVPVGSFPAATGGRWGGYGTGTPDTSQNGEYNMGKTCSIVNGVLDIHVWSELINGVQKSYGAAPWPIIPGNQPNGVIGDFTYSNVQVRANIFYGEIEFAFRAAQAAPGWKTAWLLWPDMGGNLFPKYGEIDFPEGAINGTDTIHAFMHRKDATVGSDQDSRNTGVVYADAAHTWHVAKLVWKPNVCEFWLDGVKQGATITSRVPDTPMHWVFQTETQLSGGPPPLSSTGHMQIDWIVVRQLDGIYP